LLWVPQSAGLIGHGGTHGISCLLAWLTDAQLFDERRLEIEQQFMAPYNPSMQLPLVADLDQVRRRKLALADLADLLEDAPGVAVDDVTAGLADEFDINAFKDQLGILHQAILDCLVGDDQPLAAYQLGLGRRSSSAVASERP
jgi:hypothetical protein